MTSLFALNLHGPISTTSNQKFCEALGHNSNHQKRKFPHCGERTSVYSPQHLAVNLSGAFACTVPARNNLKHNSSKSIAPVIELMPVAPQ
jgi:threonine dehydrogenase-like Zn-dependent dehydrogenase